MDEFEVGDEVRDIDVRIGYVAVVEDVICDYGEHKVGIRYMDGEYREISEYSVEYIGPDKFEYAVQSSFLPFDEDSWEEAVVWEDQESATKRLGRVEASNARRIADGLEAVVRVRLIRRRKAGKVEVVTQ